VESALALVLVVIFPIHYAFGSSVGLGGLVVSISGLVVGFGGVVVGLSGLVVGFGSSVVVWWLSCDLLVGLPSQQSLLPGCTPGSLGASCHSGH
jgi:hypothetical protein